MLREKDSCRKEKGREEEEGRGKKGEGRRENEKGGKGVREK